MPNIRHQFEATITELLRRRTELARAEAEVLRDFNTGLAKYGYRLNAIAMPPVNDAHTTIYAGQEIRANPNHNHLSTEPGPAEANDFALISTPELKAIEKKIDGRIRKMLNTRATYTPRKRKGHKQTRGHFGCRACKRMFGYPHHLARHINAMHTRKKKAAR